MQNHRCDAAWFCFPLSWCNLLIRLRPGDHCSLIRQSRHRQLFFVGLRIVPAARRFYDGKNEIDRGGGEAGRSQLAQQSHATPKVAPCRHVLDEEVVGETCAKRCCYYFERRLPAPHRVSMLVNLILALAKHGSGILRFDALRLARATGRSIPDRRWSAFRHIGTGWNISRLCDHSVSSRYQCLRDFMDELSIDWRCVLLFTLACCTYRRLLRFVHLVSHCPPRVHVSETSWGSLLTLRITAGGRMSADTAFVPVVFAVPGGWPDRRGLLDIAGRAS